jgi:hypothetical protein
MAFGLPVSQPGGAGGGPGPPGPPGPPTATTALYVQPAVDAAVTIAVNSSVGAIVGGALLVSGGGGAYVISAVPDATHITIINLGSSGLVTNAAPAANVASGSIVTYDGPAVKFLTGLDLTFTVAAGYKITATVTSLGVGGAGGTLPVLYSNMQFGSGVAAPTISIAGSGAAIAEDLNLTGSFTSLGGGSNGNINLNLPAPPAGGPTRFYRFKMAGIICASVGAPASSTSFGAFWLFQSGFGFVENAANFAVECNPGGQIFINCAQNSGLWLGNNNDLSDAHCPVSIMPSGLQLFSITTNFGGGTGVLSYKAASVAPTLALPGGYGATFVDPATGDFCFIGTSGVVRHVAAA